MCGERESEKFSIEYIAISEVILSCLNFSVSPPQNSESTSLSPHFFSDLSAFFWLVSLAPAISSTFPYTSFTGPLAKSTPSFSLHDLRYVLFFSLFDFHPYIPYQCEICVGIVHDYLFVVVIPSLYSKHRYGLFTHVSFHYIILNLYLGIGGLGSEFEEISLVRYVFDLQTPHHALRRMISQPQFVPPTRARKYLNRASAFLTDFHRPPPRNQSHQHSN